MTVGLATIALAVFAFVELLRERAADMRAKARTRARLSSEGFMLRRQIRSWIGQEPKLRKGLRGWLELVRARGSFGAHITQAESRMIEIAALASEIGGDTEREISAAYQGFLRATSILTNFDAVSPSDASRPTWQRSLEESEEQLRYCVQRLERDAITPRMLAAAEDAVALTIPPRMESEVGWAE
jgi:hypothetical protein